MEAKTEGVRKLWEKYKIIGIVMAMGVVLLLWPGGEDPAVPGCQTVPETEDTLRQEMEELLSVMDGVGQVRVLLTTERTVENRFAQDGEVAYRGDPAAPEDYLRRAETVLVEGSEGDKAVVVQKQYPTYRGALVVCQGGDRAEVQLAVTEAVSALTGLSADRITVAKWQ